MVVLACQWVGRIFKDWLWGHKSSGIYVGPLVSLLSLELDMVTLVTAFGSFGFCDFLKFIFGCTGSSLLHRLSSVAESRGAALSL